MVPSSVTACKPAEPSVLSHAPLALEQQAVIVFVIRCVRETRCAAIQVIAKGKNGDSRVIKNAQNGSKAALPNPINDPNG